MGLPDYPLDPPLAAACAGTRLRGDWRRSDGGDGGTWDGRSGGVCDYAVRLG